MNQKPIKTGILSFGMSGKVFHAPFLHLHPGFELSAMVERSEKKAFNDYPDIRSYDSVDGLLSDAELELVVVNTPNDTHAEYIEKALQAGKHVLVEKPFVTNPIEARRLFEKAKSLNLCLLPYQNRRFDTDFLSVKSVVESGALGTLVEVHFRFDRYRPQIGPKKFKENPIPGSGLLFDLGPHLLDQVISLFGRPDKWTKTVGFFREQTQVDDYAQLQLSYASGLQVFVTASLLTLEALPSFQLYGSTGTYFKGRTDPQETQLLGGMTPDNPLYGRELHGDEGRLWLVDKNGSKNLALTALSNSTYMQLFEEVYQSIRFGAAYPVREEDILLQLTMLCQ